MFSDEERENRMSVGECPEASDHDTHWMSDGHGYCRACGAEFIEPIPSVPVVPETGTDRP